MPPASLLSPAAQRPFVLHACTLAGLVMASTALGHLIGNEFAPWLAASIATAFMVRAAVSLATRRFTASETGFGSLLSWCLVMGVLNVPVSFLAAAMVVSPDPGIPIIAMIATVLGAPVGLVLGLVFGVVLGVPTARLVTAIRRPSDHARDELVTAVGLWLAMVALVCILLPLDGDRVYPLWGLGTPPRSLLFETVCSVVMGLGTIAALRGSARRRARVRWVRAVAQGEIAQWLIEALPADVSGLESLPLLGASSLECGHVLYRIEDPGRGSYRHAETRWPVARVPSDWVTASITARRG